MGEQKPFNTLQQTLLLLALGCLFIPLFLVAAISCKVKMPLKRKWCWQVLDGGLAVFCYTLDFAGRICSSGWYIFDFAGLIYSGAQHIWHKGICLLQAIRVRRQVAHKRAT